MPTRDHSTCAVWWTNVDHQLPGDSAQCRNISACRKASRCRLPAGTFYHTYLSHHHHTTRHASGALYTAKGDRCRADISCLHRALPAPSTTAPPSLCDSRT